MRASEQDRREMTGGERVEIEKKDQLAMWISGILTIGLPCLLLILLIIGVTMLLFGR